MEHSIEWHKQRLIFQKNYILAEEAKAAKILSGVIWLKKQFTEYENQIQSAERLGLTAFDEHIFHGPPYPYK